MELSGDQWDQWWSVEVKKVKRECKESFINRISVKIHGVIQNHNLNYCKPQQRLQKQRSNFNGTLPKILSFPIF